MKTENYTSLLAYFIGFFGIFGLMIFQPQIEGTKSKSLNVDQIESPLDNTNNLQASSDTLVWYGN